VVRTVRRAEGESDHPTPLQAATAADFMTPYKCCVAAFFAKVTINNISQFQCSPVQIIMIRDPDGLSVNFNIAQIVFTKPKWSGQVKKMT
jgi:hypothetical protein